MKAEKITDIALLKQRDEGKVSLRIKSGLIILVKPENCNRAYAEAYLMKIADGEKSLIEQSTQYKKQF